jgi:hypothetical protein
MNITIRLLAPELSADYFDFFENRAFPDDSPQPVLLPGLSNDQRAVSSGV